MAAGVERTAQRTDRPRIGRAPGHVLRLERVLADRTDQRFPVLPGFARLARQIVFALGQIGDGRRGDEGDDQRHIGRERCHGRPKCAHMGEQCHRRRQQHRAEPHRIDVVKVRSLELDTGRRQTQRLVDEQVGRDRAQPRHGDDREDPQRLVEHLVDAQFHQQQRNGDVEQQPDHPARMAVRQAGEEVRPGERARIGVHHVDLELRDDDEHHHQQQRRRVRGDHVAERHRVHLAGLGGVLDRHPLRDDEHGEERADQELGRPDQHPASAGEKHREAVPLAARPFRRQEPEEVDLLADLRHQRQDHRRRRAKAREVERRRAARRPRHCVDAGEGAPEVNLSPVGEGDEDDRQDVEHDPDRLRQDLEAADQLDAVCHQRNYRHRADDEADPQRHAESELQRPRHDRGLDGKQDEGKARIDQRGDGRADIAKARPPGEEVDVDAVPHGKARDRHADDEDGDAGDDDGDHRIGGAIGEGDRAADRLERQEGNGPDRGVRDAVARIAAGALGGEPERIVLKGLVGDPAIVLASDGKDALPRH